MLPWLAVALGGAIGSVARYAVGLLAAQLWGEAFPWGTLLINVAGSCAIGAFAAATLPGGLLPASPAWRLFLMVGVCGGFTTFSSFSLQTLQLLRDGNLVAAFGYVAASVLLCLAAVGAGQWGAERLGRVGQAQAGTAAVLAVLDHPGTVRPVLDAAALMAARTGCRMEALHLHPDSIASFLPTEEVLTGSRREEIAAERADRPVALRRRFEAWCDASGAEPPRWREAEGDARTAIAAAGQGACLIVVGHAPDPAGHDTRAARAALAAASAPVLLVPAASDRRLGQHAAVDPRCDGDATRFLRGTGRVTPLDAPQSAEGDRMAALLRQVDAVGADLLVTRADDRLEDAQLAAARLAVLVPAPS